MPGKSQMGRMNPYHLLQRRWLIVALTSLMTSHFSSLHSSTIIWSTINVLFVTPYKKLERLARKLILDHEPLLSFSGDVTQPLGSDQMELGMGNGNCYRSIRTDFIVVDASSSYNAILGRKAINCKQQSLVV